MINAIELFFRGGKSFLMKLHCYILVGFMTCCSISLFGEDNDKKNGEANLNTLSEKDKEMLVVEWALATFQNNKISFDSLWDIFTAVFEGRDVEADILGLLANNLVLNTQNADFHKVEILPGGEVERALRRMGKHHLLEGKMLDLNAFTIFPKQERVGDESKANE